MTVLHRVNRDQELLGAHGGIMADNIEALLSRLPQEGFAHEVVSLLRGQRRDRWDQILKAFLEKSVSQEIDRCRHAPDKTLGD